MSVRVGVRVRPFSPKEIAKGADCVVSMSGNSTFLLQYDPLTELGKRQFSFDFSFWSTNDKDAHFVSQARVYECVGTQVLKDSFEGYNSCVFAYGQTGSGKSYTMMGNPGSDKGLIPRLCEDLFLKIDALKASSEGVTCNVEVSYMEIYNEKVKDLLNPANTKLKVREHASTGPYVEDLTTCAVSNFDMIHAIMTRGNKARTVASTTMNNTSSRSHAIFLIKFSQSKRTVSEEEEVQIERVSKINLVDLAGSEKSGQINASNNERLREGNNINKALSTLGKVISALAERSTGKNKNLHIPYRDSVLTRLLQESLGGNSKTFMLATISPARENIEESLSTLRYANQAKNIVNKAVVNEDGANAIVRKLTAEIEVLKAKLAALEARGNYLPSIDESESLLDEPMTPTHDVGLSSSDFRQKSDEETSIQHQIIKREKLKNTLTISHKEKEEKTQELLNHQLSTLGIMMSQDGGKNFTSPLGVMAPRTVPYLFNTNLIHEDECLLFYFKDGATKLLETPEGIIRFLDPLTPNMPLKLSYEESFDQVSQDTVEICWFECDLLSTPPIVILHPVVPGAIEVNDEVFDQPVMLVAGDRLLVSKKNSYTFQNPSGRKANGRVILSGPSPLTLFTPRPNSAASASLPSSRTPSNSDLSSSFTSEERSDSIISSAEDDELDFVAARDKATLSFARDMEDTLLSELITDMSTEKHSFKLMSAYALYMMVRYCHNHQGDAAVIPLLNKITTLIKMTAFEARTDKDLSKLAFWLANGSEFLMALRSDEVIGSASGEAQFTLTEIVQELFTYLVRAVRQRLEPCLNAILGIEEEYDAWWKVFSKKKVNPPSLQQDANYAVDTLEIMYRVFSRFLVSHAMMEQFFGHVYYYLGASLFNRFIKNKDLFRWERGLNIKITLTRFFDWNADRKFNNDDYLDHILQSTLLLQSNKTSVANLDSICDACFALNSIQIERILRNYRPSSDEGRPLPTLIECIKARAMNKADISDQEDDSVLGKVQLERNPDFALPFRLSGSFHMKTGLRDSKIIGTVTNFASSLMLMDAGLQTPTIASPPMLSAIKRKKGSRSLLDAATWAHAAQLLEDDEDSLNSTLAPLSPTSTLNDTTCNTTLAFNDSCNRTMDTTFNSSVFNNTLDTTLNASMFDKTLDTTLNASALNSTLTPTAHSTPPLSSRKLNGSVKTECVEADYFI